MKDYVKPEVLANEELAEGVYAASGAVSGSESDSGAGTGEPSVSVSNVEETSTGNAYYKVNVYTVTVGNSGGEAADSWSTSVSITAGTVDSVSTYDPGLAGVSLNGDKITITPGERGSIPAGGSIKVSVVVSYSSDSVTVQ